MQLFIASCVAVPATSGLTPFNFGLFLGGTLRASLCVVAGATRIEDLLVWQRAHALHVEVWRATNQEPASRDFKFRDQIRDAGESIERNVAEGFGRFNPGQFAHFLDIARASTLETKVLLRKGLDVGYWNTQEFARLDGLADRVVQAIAKFQRYLRSPQAKSNAAHRYR